MKRIVVLLLMILCPVSFADSALKLIPTPRYVKQQEGVFKFAANAGIVLTDPESQDDQFAANQVIDEAQNSLKVSLHLGRPTNDPAIVIYNSGANGVHGTQIESLSPDKLGLHIPDDASAETYQLLVSPGKIEIYASTPAGRFNAVQTLRQLMRANSTNDSIPCCKIVDWPALKYRVWQDDISRGPIPTMDFLKREVRTFSELKYNAMTLYTEHVFKLAKHPDIAPDDGITAEQIKELSEYAKQYHVELIGNFQSFGHMAHILSLPAYKDLGDNGWNISPAKEATYKFLDECYSEVAPAYESKLFDINCDEVSLGKDGASKEMVAKLGLAEVYARHISRICDLLRPYGKTAMMWGDIAVQHQDIVPKLPKDLIVLSWGYSAKDNFDDAIEPFTKTGLRFMVCPGVSCWNRIFPDFQHRADQHRQLRSRWRAPRRDRNDQHILGR